MTPVAPCDNSIILKPMPQSTRSQSAEAERLVHIGSDGNIFVESQRYSIANLSTAFSVHQWNYGIETNTKPQPTIYLLIYLCSDRNLTVGVFKQIIAELRNLDVPEIALITEWVISGANTPGSFNK